MSLRDRVKNSAIPFSFYGPSGVNESCINLIKKGTEEDLIKLIRKRGFEKDAFQSFYRLPFAFQITLYTNRDSFENSYIPVRYFSSDAIIESNSIFYKASKSREGIESDSLGQYLWHTQELNPVTDTLLATINWLDKEFDSVYNFKLSNLSNPHNEMIFRHGDSPEVVDSETYSYDDNSYLNTLKYIEKHCINYSNPKKLINAFIDAMNYLWEKNTVLGRILTAKIEIKCNIKCNKNGEL